MSAAGLDSAHHLRTLSDMQRVILWEADAQSWQITYVSPQAVSLLGYPIEKWYAPGFWVEHLHPEERVAVEGQCRELIASQDFFELNYRMIRFDGGVKWFRDLIGVTRELGIPRTLRGCMVEVDEFGHKEDPSAERFALERMYSEMAAAFVNLSPGQVDSKVEGGLQTLVEALRTDRATLGEKDPLTGDLIVTHSWARPGCPTTPRMIAKEMFPWSVDKIRKGEIVFYRSPEELPEEASTEREYLLSVGVKSALVVPLHSAGELIGTMATESFQTLRDWDPVTISRFVLAGTVFCNALARKRADEALQKAHSQVKELRWDLEEKLKFETMLAELSATFVNLPPDEVDTKVERGLRTLAEVLGNDRATLGQKDPLTGDLIATHSWSRPGIPTFPQWIVKEMLPWLVDRIEKGEIVSVRSPEDLPAEAIREREYMLSSNVKSSLIMPLQTAGNLIGAISTDSFQKYQAWDGETVSRFQVVGTVFCNALARKRADEELQKAYSLVKELKRDLEQRLRFEALLAELSAQFVNLPAGQVDGMIETAQKRICEVLGLNRSTLAQLDETKKDLLATHSWVAPGFSRFLGFSGKRNVPWMVRKILNGEHIQISRVDDLPEEAAKDKETLHQDGLKSNVTIPLFDGEKVFGAIAFGAMRAEREWPEDLIGRLTLIAQVFASALVRKRASEALLAAFSEIADLKNRLEMENIYLRKEITGELHQSRVTGQSAAIRDVLTKARQVAETDSVVLIIGETGTGKELMASFIHQWSRRKDRTMIKINCAALPATLIESELFGREKGAYTGALSREIGRFELADKSTILLDEIGELPMELQAKLLRVLEEGEFERLGSSKTLRVDTRVIAATSRDLRAMVKEGKFREDLFYRLNVFPIHVPPLRERREDIPALMWDIIRELGTRMGRNVESIRASTLKEFQEYSWPGNVRELRNIIERYLILKPGPVFQAELPKLDEPSAQAGHTLEQIDSVHILQVLKATRWRIRGKGGAAEILGLKPTTLEARMKKLKIHRPH